MRTSTGGPLLGMLIAIVLCLRSASDMLPEPTRCTPKDILQTEQTWRQALEFGNPNELHQSARALRLKPPRLAHCRKVRQTARLPENTKDSWATAAAGRPATTYWCP